MQHRLMAVLPYCKPDETMIHGWRLRSLYLYTGLLSRRLMAVMLLYLRPNQETLSKPYSQALLPEMDGLNSCPNLIIINRDLSCCLLHN